MNEPQPLTDLQPAEIAFINFVSQKGVRAPGRRELRPATDVADDGQSDCWTHAWRLAQRTGGTYVEGLVIRGNADGPSFHAWVEKDDWLIECTPGYENGHDYLGIAVDCTPGGEADQATLDWTWRVSVIQACIASDMPLTNIIIKRERDR